MKYNIETINEYVAKGLLDKCDHKELPIALYKYSRNCQFEWTWDDITMNMRGTVLDTEGNVVAKTFPKFFNIESDNFPNLPLRFLKNWTALLVFYLTMKVNGIWQRPDLFIPMSLIMQGRS